MRAAQGVLEYVEDKVRFLGALRCAYPRALQLLSYAFVDNRPPHVIAQSTGVPTTLNSRARLQGVLEALRLNVTAELPTCFFGPTVCVRLTPPAASPRGAEREPYSPSPA